MADEAPARPKRIRNRSEKTRLVRIDQIDKRSKAAQLALETKNSIVADLGGIDQLSTLERLTAEHASLASAVTADSYARWLMGEDIALAEIATLQNAFLRCAGALGFSRRAKDVTPSIESYLAANGAKSDPMSPDEDTKEPEPAEIKEPSQPR